MSFIHISTYLNISNREKHGHLDTRERIDETENKVRGIGVQYTDCVFSLTKVDVCTARRVSQHHRKNKKCTTRQHARLASAGTLSFRHRAQCSSLHRRNRKCTTRQHERLASAGTLSFSHRALFSSLHQRNTTMNHMPTRTFGVSLNSVAFASCSIIKFASTKQKMPQRALFSSLHRRNKKCTTRHCPITRHFQNVPP